MRQFPEYIRDMQRRIVKNEKKNTLKSENKKPFIYINTKIFLREIISTYLVQ